jgi:hypothetical protein
MFRNSSANKQVKELISFWVQDLLQSKYEGHILISGNGSAFLKISNTCEND